ncbi:hypothetical protein [Streptomyces sp. V2I9]|uniref:hypothetical protein n=1 Tax=Streptomyces sp. V2I9 TaxID=3042304 RepID=UPI002781C7F2|nr:hypothetical protein [Streptomyces sp. V2I9]MDQ0986907.1 hypothetical protein [Streptomyces sp. V2I9]
MFLVIALLVRAEPPRPDRWTAGELARWLGSRPVRAGPHAVGPVHVHVVEGPDGTVRAALYMESPDPVHAELAALEHLLAALSAARPASLDWRPAALGGVTGCPPPHRLPEPKGPDPPCHGSAPPCQ